jgi:2,4-dienoyl-CoA reductase-like NADH-dependent reductase (Old Yellow Enzyme family)
MVTNALARSVKVGGFSAPNRIAALPTEGNNAEESGTPSKTTIDRYRALAEGGAGIVYVEATAVHPEGRARKRQLRIGDDTSRGFAALASEFKRANPDALLLFQLDHAGPLADPRFSTPVAVGPRPGAGPRLLTDADIAELRSLFVHAVEIAAEAGADGVEFKLAHGFLLNDFLRPGNQRSGAYGGSFENRIRFIIELLDGARAVLKGKRFILSARISAYEGAVGGFGSPGPEGVVEAIEEPLAFAVAAAAAGLDLLSVSGGSSSANLEILLPTSRYPEGVYRHFGWTRRLKAGAGIPVIGAGYSYLRDGHNDLPGDNLELKSLAYWARRNVEEGLTDIVGLGRQVIADPAFPRKLLAGDFGAMDFCTTCSGCGVLLGAQKNVGCVVYDKHYKKLFEE